MPYVSMYEVVRKYRIKHSPGLPRTHRQPLYSVLPYSICASDKKLMSSKTMFVVLVKRVNPLRESSMQKVLRMVKSPGNVFNRMKATESIRLSNC